MASEMVSGCVIPLRVADHPALELCNTGAGWTLSDHRRPNPAKDYLIDARTLLVWAGAVGVLGSAEVAEGERAAAADPAAAARAVTEAVRLRSTLYALYTTAPEIWGTDDVDRPVAGLRAAVAVAVRASGLRLADDGRSTWDGGADPLRRPVHRLALLGMSLLADHGPAAVGRCTGDGCGWLFLNRGGRRVWCLMPICGNRAKARRYAERNRRV
jgi:predicted RNA-binding Zn ribbon-like protein